MPRAQISIAGGRADGECPVRETSAAAATLSLASGQERAVRSPALELQEALEEMLTVPAIPRTRPGAVLALAVGGAAAVGACSVFWLALGRMLISLA